MKREAETRLDRARAAFGQIPGVIGVGVGFKRTGGRMLDFPALRVTVLRKRPLSEVAADERLPAFFEGVPIDVCEPLETVGIVAPGLDGGAEISTPAVEGSGTLGCFASISSGKTVLLTAGHNFRDGGGPIPTGLDVGAPAVHCCCCCTTGLIGQTSGGKIDSALDCAIASLNSNRTPVQLLPGLGSTIGSDGKPTGNNADQVLGTAPLVVDPTSGKSFSVAMGQHVRKLGATTNVTGGVVTDLDIPVGSDTTLNLPAMTGQIAIKALQVESFTGSNGKFNFALHGDSGSVVLDNNNLVVGLLHRAAIFKNPGPNEGFGGVIQDIAQVTQFLQITIVPSSKDLTGTTTASALLPGGPLRRVPPATRTELDLRAVLERLRSELSAFALGRKLVAFVERHHPEIGHSANHSRRFKVAWHRARGPQLIAQWLGGARTLEQPLPASVDGSRPIDALVAAHRALQQVGTPALVDEMRDLWPPVERAAVASATLRQLVDNLREGDRP